MIRLLHIETSTRVCSVAISEDGVLKDFRETHSDRYIHAEKLTIFIESLLQKNGWQMPALSAIVVSRGPGSYTGLRIGVSTAKGLCFALSIPLISVSSLDALIELGREKHPGQSVCALIDARRMEVFSRIADEKDKTLKPTSADILEASTYEEHDPFVVVGDGAEKVVDLWEHRSLTIAADIHSSARGQVKLATASFKAEKFEDVAYFEPFYLKDFIATKSKKQHF